MEPPFDEAGAGTGRFHGFQDLVQERVQDVLLVSTLYDYYILSQDGRLNEQLLSEFLELNLRHTPNITRVFSGAEALEKARQSARYNLIVTTIELGDMNVLELVLELRTRGIQTPVVLLAHDQRALHRFTSTQDVSPLERIFLWQGDVRILLAIVKYLEDKLNVAHDTGVAGVPVVILVEDDVRYYSSFLPLLYSELVKHSLSLMPEGLNLSDKLMRIRARPKVLLCDHYEEAWQCFDRYADEVLGIVSDMRFPRDGDVDPLAGLSFGRAVRERRPDVPIMLQSSRAENEAHAKDIGASFLLKRSRFLLGRLRSFMSESLRIGDFVFRLPDGTVIDRASDLRSLEQKLQDVPAESLAFHGQRNDFSTWLKARTEFDLAERLRPRKVSDYETVEELRASVIQSIAEYRHERNRGEIVDFDRRLFDGSASFYRIGGGSLGGKARGIAFVNNLLNEYHVDGRFPDVHVFVPTSVVLATDVFDRFLEENHLADFAIDCEREDVLHDTFQAATFPEEVVEELRVLLQRARYPLAVRSSSLLEDSQYQPFAGVYDTFMLPNNDARLNVRLERLLSAVKAVYASTFSHRARSYIQQTPYRLEEEKMAVIIQRVVGEQHGSRFYPTLSGSARSHNVYPMAPAGREDGIAAVALGLGKSVVEGCNCVRFSPNYPKHIPGSAASRIESSQRDFYALDLDRGESDGPIRYGIDAAETDGSLASVASTYSADNAALFDGVSRVGTRVVTFAPVLNHGLFPLAPILQTLLAMGVEGTRSAVELEFAANVRGGGAHPDRGDFAFLQLRPLQLSEELEPVEIGDERDADVLCRSTKVLGNGRIDDLYDIVVVNYERFERKDSAETAGEVGRLNGRLAAENRPYLLIGVGRWGSREPTLGIPVYWSQITGARVIIEAGFRDLRVTPSQGTHFFQNLIANRVGYFTVNPEDGDGTLDWKWLLERSPNSDRASVRHLQFDRPVIAKMDGERNKGVVLKPGAVDERGGPRRSQ